MTRELYDPSKKPVTTISPSGIIYDSGFEARVGMYVHDKLGIFPTYTNNICFTMATYGGQYKPDYGLTLPDGTLSVVEVKGWVSARVEHVKQLMKAKVLDPADIVSKYSVIWTRGIEVFDGSTPDYVPGAFYTCPECGMSWVLPKTSHDCPNCEARCDYDCCNVNDAFNQWWRETGWGPVWEKWLPTWIAQQDARKESEKIDARYSKYLQRAYPGLNLRKQKKNDKDLVFLTRFASDGTYTPEFYYTEPRANVSRFGTALDPIAVVIIADFNDNYRAALLRQMNYFVNNIGCPVTKVVHIDHLGIHVCDKHNPLGFVDGAIYRCDKCGKEYFAPKNHRECPCCDSASTTKLSK